MIGPATGWFEVHKLNDKRSKTVANTVEQEWLIRYPWPIQITYDRGSKLIGAEFQARSMGYKLQFVNPKQMQSAKDCIKRLKTLLHYTSLYYITCFKMSQQITMASQSLQRHRYIVTMLLNCCMTYVSIYLQASLGMTVILAHSHLFTLCLTLRNADGSKQIG